MSTLNVTEQQKEWGIKGGAWIATAIFCYTVMIGPVFRDIASLHQNIVNSERRVELYRGLQEMSTALENNEGSLATMNERSKLLGRISDVAARNQIRIQTLAPRTEQEGEYVKLRVEIGGRGVFFSLIKFLQAVENIGTAVKIRDISVLWKPVPKVQMNQPQTGQYPLQIHFVFETLLKQRAKKSNV